MGRTAGSSSTADFIEQYGALRRFLDEAQRDPATFAISKRVYLAVDKDRERAAKRLREWFGLYYGQSDLAERVSVWGDVEECVAGLREIASAGAHLLVLNPVFDMMDHLEVLAGKVIPQIRGR